VLFVLVARSAGLGLNGYAFMFAALGAGGMAGTTLAGRAARLPYRRVLIAALSAVGLSVAGVALLPWAAAILIVVAIGGAASLLVEITMSTSLQRMLPRDVFGRAYGLAVPASIGVIGAGSLLAPVLDSTLGRTGALLACAAAVLAYTAFLALSARRPAPAAQLRSPAGDHGPGNVMAALPASRPADSFPIMESRLPLDLRPGTRTAPRADQESNPMPSRSSPRSHRLRRPWFRSAAASAARVSWMPA